MENQGWISLHRKIQQNTLYFAEPFTRIMAWIDLILITNHKPGTIYVRGNKIEIERGQFAWGEDALAQRWKWSRGKVRRFLITLVKSQNIVQQKSHVLSLYTITNYNQYQLNDTTDGQQTIQQTDINNNDNNDNKNIDTNVSILPKADKRDPEIDLIVDVFKEYNGSIPIDAKPRQWAYHIKRLLIPYLAKKQSSLKPHESMKKFLESRQALEKPITFNKLQTIYYHLRSIVYKNEKSQ